MNKQTKKETKKELKLKLDNLSQSSPTAPKTVRNAKKGKKKGANTAGDLLRSELTAAEEMYKKNSDDLASLTAERLKLQGCDGFKCVNQILDECVENIQEDQSTLSAEIDRVRSALLEIEQTKQV